MPRAALTLCLAAAMLTACGAAPGDDTSGEAAVRQASLSDRRALTSDRGATDETIGLQTSLPIVWRETSGVSDLLVTEGPSHWALKVLRRLGDIVPLDTLDGARGVAALPNQSLLVLAQPRVLSPGDNVALDDWVRAGGHVLLFADPMLTAESHYPLGDPRRPQDVALLSPILARWGLELVYDEDQPRAERIVTWRDVALPVDLRGSWDALGRDCAIEAEALIARCRIGAGEVLAVADAAVLDDSHEPGDSSSPKALETLIQAARGL